MEIVSNPSVADGWAEVGPSDSVTCFVLAN